MPTNCRYFFRCLQNPCAWRPPSQLGDASLCAYLPSDGLCSATWLERSLERLVQVEAEADVSCESFLHLDVRSDNLCFDGPRTLLVDWNLATIGNPRIELIGWLPSLSVEGGPPPEQLTGPDDAPFRGDRGRPLRRSRRPASIVPHLTSAYLAAHATHA